MEAGGRYLGRRWGTRDRGSGDLSGSQIAAASATGEGEQADDDARHQRVTHVPVSSMVDRTEGWRLPAEGEECSGGSPVKRSPRAAPLRSGPTGVTGGYPQKGMSSSSCSAMPVGRPRSDGPEPGAGERWPVSPPKSSGDPIPVPPPSRAPPRSVSSPRKRDSTTSVVERSCPPWSVHLRVWSWPST